MFDSIQKKLTKAIDEINEKKYLKDLSKEDEKVCKISYNVVWVSDHVYNCALASSISHGKKLTPYYKDQADYVSRIMGYGHDSICAHSNIVFLVEFVTSANYSYPDLLSNLQALKYFEIEEIKTPYERRIVTELKPLEELKYISVSKRYFLMGASIRALRYYYTHIYKDALNTELFKVIHSIINLYSEKLFYKDIQALQFGPSYYPEFIQNMSDITKIENDEDDVNVPENRMIAKHSKVLYTTGKHDAVVEFVNYPSMYKVYNTIVNGMKISEESNDFEIVRGFIISAMFKTLTITFKLSHYSRAISQQINRHESAITQSSQRFINEENAEFIDPMKFVDKQDKQYIITMNGNTKPYTSEELGKELSSVYSQLIKYGMLKQEARSFLPINTATKAYHTFTIENLIHFINVREDKASQPEVQEIARSMDVLLRKVLTFDTDRNIFIDAFEERLKVDDKQWLETQEIYTKESMIPQ